MAERQWYQEYQDQLAAEQAGKSRQEVANMLDSQYEPNPYHLDEQGRPILQKKFDHVFDPANAPKVEHRWIDRGLKMSCEGAGHDYHQAWKRQPMY